MKNKKIFGIPITLFVIGLLAIGGVTAALLIYYGKLTQTVNVQQAVTLTGGNLCNNNICSESDISGFSGDTLVSEVYTLTNLADTPREVDLKATYTPTVQVGEIVTSYLKSVDYSYSKVWSENGDVLVTVDTGDGWLEWKYTAQTPVTSGTLKMTVEIDNPTGFGITTFDDGSHDGWYYYDTEGIVRISDYNGSNKISGYDWVETIVGADSMTVRIKKDHLPNTFMWQGYANFHLASNWIELDTSVSPWVPTGVGTIMETLALPYTLQGREVLNFVVSNYFNTDGFSGTITTTVIPGVDEAKEMIPTP